MWRIVPLPISTKSAGRIGQKILTKIKFTFHTVILLCTNRIGRGAPRYDFILVPFKASGIVLGALKYNVIVVTLISTDEAQFYFCAIHMDIFALTTIVSGEKNGE